MPDTRKKFRQAGIWESYIDWFSDCECHLGQLSCGITQHASQTLAPPTWKTGDKGDTSILELFFIMIVLTLRKIAPTLYPRVPKSYPKESYVKATKKAKLSLFSGYLFEGTSLRRYFFLLFWGCFEGVLKFLSQKRDTYILELFSIMIFSEVAENCPNFSWRVPCVFMEPSLQLLRGNKLDQSSELWLLNNAISKL